MYLNDYALYLVINNIIDNVVYLWLYNCLHDICKHSKCRHKVCVSILIKLGSHRVLIFERQLIWDFCSIDGSCYGKYKFAWRKSSCQDMYCREVVWPCSIQEIKLYQQIEFFTKEILKFLNILQNLLEKHDTKKW